MALYEAAEPGVKPGLSIVSQPWAAAFFMLNVDTGIFLAITGASGTRSLRCKHMVVSITRRSTMLLGIQGD
jgi:hypothetical protein